MIESGLEVAFRVPKASWTRVVRVADLHPETFRKVVEYGAMRLVNDRVGGKDVTGDKLAEAIEAVWSNIQTGDWDEARERLSPFDAAMRELLFKQLRKTGLKGADAAKQARKMDEAIRLLATRRAEKVGESVEAAEAKVREVLTETATRMAEAKVMDDLI
jgi:hypothetical protein